MMDFSLPSDGSVLIVDDKFEDAMPLIQLLSKKGIACTYYSGTKDNELPEEPAQKIRLAFFDIQLFPASSSHAYAQNILRLLEKFISEDNGPYLLILWSNTFEVHGDEVEEQVMALNSARKPLIVVRLEKSDFFEQVPDAAERDSFINDVMDALEGAFDEDDSERIKTAIRERYISDDTKTAKTAKSDAIQSIIDKLNKYLVDVDAFQVFTIWENIINKASGQMVRSYSELYKDENGKHRAKNIKYIIYKMACVQTGKWIDVDNELLKQALKTLNQTFLDEVENQINKVSKLLEQIKIDKDKLYYCIKIDDQLYKLHYRTDPEKYEVFKGDALIAESCSFDKLKKGGNEDKVAVQKIAKKHEAIKLEINTRLHVDINIGNDRPSEPGNLYEKDVDDKRRKEILKDYFKRENNGSKEIKFVELEVSPRCDFVQKKRLKSRLLPGIMIPEKIADRVSIKESLYSGIPIIKYEEKNYKLIFNFKLFKSVCIESLHKQPPLFRLRRELHADIISHLSGHISRLGISSVE